MTTSTLDMTRAGTELRRPAWGRFLPGIGGLGLVAGLIAIMVSPASDDTGETPAQVIEYAQSHEAWTVGIALFGLASIAFGGAFVAGLYDRLHAVATRTESVLILIGGTLFTICFALCWTIWTAPLTDTPGNTAADLAMAQAYLSYDDIGWFVLGMAGVAAAVMAVPASLAAIRAGVPAWLGWLGVIAGVASLGTVAFLGMFAWMAWIAVASVVLLVARRA
jgi:hypothetical protein